VAEEPWVARGKGGRRKDGVVDGWISGGGLEEEKKTRPPLAFHFDCVDNFLVLLMLTKISSREESQREKSREKKKCSAFAIDGSFTSRRAPFFLFSPRRTFLSHLQER